MLSDNFGIIDTKKTYPTGNYPNGYYPNGYYPNGYFPTGNYVLWDEDHAHSNTKLTLRALKIFFS